MTRLTFSQIQSITVGAIAVTQEEDGLHFQKCTQIHRQTLFIFYAKAVDKS